MNDNISASFPLTVLVNGISSGSTSSDKQKQFPKKGDKVKFISAERMIYPYYVDMIKRAKENLISDKEYTIHDIKVYSSWAAIWIDPENEKEYYNLNLFDYKTNE
jgi:hypothetical protein